MDALRLMMKLMKLTQMKKFAASEKPKQKAVKYVKLPANSGPLGSRVHTIKNRSPKAWQQRLKIILCY